MTLVCYRLFLVLLWWRQVLWGCCFCHSFVAPFPWWLSSRQGEMISRQSRLAFHWTHSPPWGQPCICCLLFLAWGMECQTSYRLQQLAQHQQCRRQLGMSWMHHRWSLKMRKKKLHAVSSAKKWNGINRVNNFCKLRYFYHIFFESKALLNANLRGGGGGGDLIAILLLACLKAILFPFTWLS